MLKRNLIVIAIMSLALIFTTNAFGQRSMKMRGIKSQRTKLPITKGLVDADYDGNANLKGRSSLKNTTTANGLVVMPDPGIRKQAKAVAVNGFVTRPIANKNKRRKFIPAQRTYKAMSVSLAGENYTAILTGDVNGNWTP